MQAIETHYIGPTNHRPARIVAVTSSGHRLIMSRWKAEELTGDPEGNTNWENIHRVVARQLAEKLDWPGRWIAGSTKRGYVFVRDSINY